MIRERENYNAFLLHFLERLNSCDSIEKKITESLTDICEYYGFKRGFIYQTDGFRYFYLKETVGNNDNVLRQRFEISEMTNQHVVRANGKNKPFYACRNQNTFWDDVDIVDFYKVDSLLIRQIQDSEGKIIGFIGFGDREHAISFTDEELQMIHLILGSLSKEIAVREYKEREVRASKTLSSIMNNMGVDIYVNSFDSHDMLYVNESMAAPYGGIEHFEGKKCWQALYKDKTGECEFCPKKHLIDENGLPTKVYSWDYQRPFDKCWFRVFSAAFAWIDGQIAHVITSVDIMQENTELLLQLISDILDLSKIEAGTLDFTMDYLDIKSFCEDIIRNYDIKEDKPVPVLLAPTLPNFYIYTDKKRLMQVITNFINNALKFTNKGQILLEYHLKEDTSEIEFSVADTGMGIEPDKVDRVFDRFVKLNSFSKGTGLGLSICRSIIEHLGGTIGVESEMGTGSRFWFTHPYQSVPL